MISFNQPFRSSNELDYVMQALSGTHTSGDGPFTKKCHSWLETNTDCKKALLTTSCTAALEMAALLINVQPGDEIIMPSYTFVSTANAFVLRGGIPVFVDIRIDTLNIDETKIESAITPKTKAIIPVHYAGVACEMDTIMAIARKHNLFVIEDAAQGVMSRYKGKNLGSIGHLGCYSFHATKNISAGEGGALLINDERFLHQAEIIREKGTNRSQFFQGQVDKYTWVDIGSSYLPSDITAAYLLSQLEVAEWITKSRIDIWLQYYHLLSEQGFSNILPSVPKECDFNAHIFYVLLNNPDKRAYIISVLKEQKISTCFHYIPLHQSPAGKKYGRSSGVLNVTNNVSERILRLPLWATMDQEQVISIVANILKLL